MNSVSVRAVSKLIFCAFPLAFSFLWGEEGQKWGKSIAIPSETEFLRDRLEEPQNHFLLNGSEGFLAGREFYQASYDATPFLWKTHPILHYGPSRAWQLDSIPLVFHAWGGQELGIQGNKTSVLPGDQVKGENLPLGYGDIGWNVFEELRLHAGFEQMDAFSSTTYPSRVGLLGKGKDDELAWLGGNLPLRSQATVGGSFTHRGTTLGAQANQGGWWTSSPVSGKVYPWNGYNAELAYKVGDDFDLSLIDQEWDSPISNPYYHAHYGRSELNMGFLGSSEGNWIWRLDVGFQRKEMLSDSAIFTPLLQQTYPTRFRYRQTWNAPDSLPLQLISQGSMGFRDRVIGLQHSSDFIEKWGPHQLKQSFKGYYQHPMTGYKIPTETIPLDSTWLAESRPGMDVRGVSSELEFREKRKNVEVGSSINYVMEWQAPLFHLRSLDTVNGSLIRSGSYLPSDYLLQNGSVHFFAQGGFGSSSDSGWTQTAFWRFQAGLRDFWGHNADSMEFKPSGEWVGLGGGIGLPTNLKLEAQVNYVGEKEVRGWGPRFIVDAHLENHVSLSASLLENRLNLSLALLHAFGEDIREQPNANPLRFRLLGGVTGAF